MARTKQTARFSTGGNYKGPTGRISKVDRIAQLSSKNQNNELDTLESSYLNIIILAFPKNKREKMVYNNNDILKLMMTIYFLNYSRY